MNALEALNGGVDGSMGGIITDNTCILQGPFRRGLYRPVTGFCLRREALTEHVMPSAAEYMDIIDSDSDYGAVWSQLSVAHGNGHTVIGANMGSGGLSPDDPMFYLHHSFVDYLWSLWANCHDHEGAEHQSFSSAYSGDVELVMAFPGTDIPDIAVKDTTDITSYIGGGYTFEKGPFWENIS